MRTKTIYSTDKTKYVTINRQLLSDGYNYYITLLQYSPDHLFYYIVDSYKQPEILSYKAALQEADRVLNNVITSYQLPTGETRNTYLHPAEFNRLQKEFTELTNLHPVEMFNRFSQGLNGYIDSRIIGNYSKPTF
jgi:hypothetical protein